MKQGLFVLFVLTCLQADADDFAKTLQSKRLILKGAQCAGLEFAEDNTVFMHAEMDCGLPGNELTTRIRWLSPTQFVITEVERMNENCPPRNWIYEVNWIKENRVELNSIWTGWNKLKDSTEEYLIVDREEFEVEELEQSD